MKDNIKEKKSDMFKLAFAKIQKREVEQNIGYKSTMSTLSNRRTTELNKISQLEQERQMIRKEYEVNPRLPIESYEKSFSNRLIKADTAQRNIQKAQVEQRLKKVGKEILNMTEKGLVKVQQVGSRIENKIEKTFSKPLLKKPSVSVPSYSPKGFIRRMASGQALAREVPEVKARLPVTSRSILFDNEAQGEIKRAKGWLFAD